MCLAKVFVNLWLLLYKKQKQESLFYSQQKVLCSHSLQKKQLLERWIFESRESREQNCKTEITMWHLLVLC